MKAKRLGPFAGGTKLRAYDRPGRGEPLIGQPGPDAGDVPVVKHIPRAARPAAPDLAQARQRLASLPDGFTNWVGTAPSWPADASEIIGLTVVKVD
ncbi:hypothetical protein MRA01_64510 [Methylobacterium radiotolerans]|nr:hypothetical protein MRA01_64510 [Methylobacterium radiotolerans]